MTEVREIEATWCFPKEIKMMDIVVMPAGEPKHMQCPGGKDGVWRCPCSCHDSEPETPEDFAMRWTAKEVYLELDKLSWCCPMCGEAGNWPEGVQPNCRDSQWMPPLYHECILTDRSKR